MSDSECVQVGARRDFASDLTLDLRRCSQLALVSIAVFLGAASVPVAVAQGPSNGLAVLSAPPPSSVPFPPMPANERSAGSIQGQVFDPTNTPLSGALVIAENGAGRESCRTYSSSEGHFSCPGLFFGEYRIFVSASGFANHTREHVTVTEIDPSVDLQVTLSLASDSTAITVYADSHEVAAEQIRAAEKQRIIGIVPNFYTSFTYDAVPLSSGQKFSLAFRDVLDPFTFLSAGVAAGIEQANNSYKGYGQGASGYAKRYAAAYGDGLTSDIFRHAVYASLFHQDPRYFYKGTGTFGSRFVHALSYAVVLRSDDGSYQPNYSYLAGYLTSGALSNTYYPHDDRGVGLVFTRALFGIAGTAGEGLLREFVFNHLTTNRHSP